MGSAQPIALSAGAKFAGVGIYRGMVARETGGAVATVRVWDNASAASGTLLDTMRLPANGSDQHYMEVAFAAGVFVEIVTGAVEGAVHIG